MKEGRMDVVVAVEDPDKLYQFEASPSGGVPFLVQGGGTVTPVAVLTTAENECMRSQGALKLTNTNSGGISYAQIVASVNRELAPGHFQAKVRFKFESDAFHNCSFIFDTNVSDVNRANVTIKMVSNYTGADTIQYKTTGASYVTISGLVLPPANYWSELIVQYRMEADGSAYYEYVTLNGKRSDYINVVVYPLAASANTTKTGFDVGFNTDSANSPAVMYIDLVEVEYLSALS